MAKFQNNNPHKKHKNLFDILKWKLTSKKPKWPTYVPLTSFDVPPDTIEDRIRISFVGHVTFLIQTAQLNILTDPVWSLRASPFSTIGPERVTAPGIAFDALPKIDTVLISHNHYDHMDITTLAKLWERDKPEIIVPLKNEKILKSKIPNIQVISLNWSERVDLKNKISIHLEPSQHWSARGLFDQNQALWGTFIIKTPIGAICFIGDSGYDPFIFKNIGHKFNKILVSLIPIGAYEPRWFMKDVHMNPEEAILTHQDLGSQQSIACHFDTFPLADDAFGQAVVELQNAREKYKISNEEFMTPSIGEAYWFG